MVPRDGESFEDLARWKWLWGQLCDEISAVHLWPSWEVQAFELLRSGLARLSAIFSYYVKAGWTCINVERPVLMDAEAWADFVADCGMATAEFDDERLQSYYDERAERNGGQPLNVIQFIGLLIRLAFLRLHPDYEEGHLDTPGMTPVPQCVDLLLKTCVYPRASSDPSVEGATRQRAAHGVIGVLALHAPALRQLFRQLGGFEKKDEDEAAEEAAAAAAAKDEKKPSGAAALLGGLAAMAGKPDGEERMLQPGEPEVTVGLGLDEWLQLMESACDKWSVETLFQSSEITGEPFVRQAWAVGLSAHQAMEAYTASRSVCEWWMHRLSFVGFTEALCRCAEAMFSCVDAMTTEQKVGGMMRLVLRLADRTVVVADSTYIKAPPRFDPVAHVTELVSEGDAKGQYTGSSAVPIGRWLDCWQALELKELHGYPTWDQPLFMLLQPYFAMICRLFASYAAPLPRQETDLSPAPLEVWSATLDISTEQWGLLISDLDIAHAPGKEPSGAPPSTPEAWQRYMALLERQPPVDESNDNRSLSSFIGALLGVAFLVFNPGYSSTTDEDGSVSGHLEAGQSLVPVPEAAAQLLEHRVPLCLMRRCLTRLQSEVDVARMVFREKEGKLQQARTRERNCAIEAAGKDKRGGGKGKEEDDDSPRRPLRHQAKIAELKSKEKATSDPAELHAEVLNRQQLLDDFARVLKRKQADLVLMENELEPLQQQEEQAKEAEREAALAATATGVEAAAEQPEVAKAKPKKPPAVVSAVKAAKAKEGARGATPPPSKRQEGALAAKGKSKPAPAVIKAKS